MEFELDPKILYPLLCARDSRFDGLFFVGVTSTHIYCRPICRVRTPKLNNCRFFQYAAAAESSGYRPCLRCRPELAPGLSCMDSSQQLAQAAVQLIETDFLRAPLTLEDLATKIGITSRHLRRIFNAQFGVSLVNYVQTRRLLLAKQLSTDTNLPIADIAEISGFGSTRRLNALFRNRYRLSPSTLRKQQTSPDNLSTTRTGDELRFILPYRPPYAWSALLEFMAARALREVEFVCLSRALYARTVHLIHQGKTYQGWFTATPDLSQNKLLIAFSTSLAQITPLLLHKIRHLFDLNCQPDLVSQKLGSLAQKEPGMRIPGAFDGFEIAVRTILGQKISVAAAITLANRLVERWGIELSSPYIYTTQTGSENNPPPTTSLLKRSFPSAEILATIPSTVLATIGISVSRAETIRSLAQAIINKTICLDPPLTGNLAQFLAALEDLPGVGPWTSQYIALRALGWPDAFPASDLGLYKALGVDTARQALQLAEKWRPWRGYAVLYLWRSLRSTPTPGLIHPSRKIDL